MSQSKAASFTEAVANTVAGMVAAMAITALAAWVHGIPITLTNNFTITAWITVASVLRAYVIRRLWNTEFWK